MNDLSLDAIEFIKILASSDSTLLEKSMNFATKKRLDSQIGTLLRYYHKEKTTGTSTEWIEKFEKAGISEDDGKSAISCARRLGMDIS